MYDIIWMGHDYDQTMSAISLIGLREDPEFRIRGMLRSEAQPVVRPDADFG